MSDHGCPATGDIVPPDRPFRTGNANPLRRSDLTENGRDPLHHRPGSHHGESYSRRGAALRPHQENASIPVNVAANEWQNTLKALQGRRLKRQRFSRTNTPMPRERLNPLRHACECNSVERSAAKSASAFLHPDRPVVANRSCEEFQMVSVDRGQAYTSSIYATISRQKARPV